MPALVLCGSGAAGNGSSVSAGDPMISSTLGLPRGFAGAKQLAASNEWQVVMACRSLDKAERARAQMPNPSVVEVRQLDLADLNRCALQCSLLIYSYKLVPYRIPI